MVNFGEKLLSAVYPPWAAFYIDYEELKQSIENHYIIGNKNSNHKSRGQVQPDFLWLLYLQTEKVTLFVLERQGQITTDVSRCRQELLQLLNNNNSHNSNDTANQRKRKASDLLSLEHQYAAAAQQLLRLIQFVTLNITGFRKILKKHDKLVGTKLSLSYLALNSNGTTGRMLPRSSLADELDLIALGNQLLQPLLQDPAMAALTAALETGIEELHSLWLQYQLRHGSRTSEPQRRVSSGKQRRSSTEPDLQAVATNNGNNATTSTTTNEASLSQHQSHCDLSIQQQQLHDQQSIDDLLLPSQRRSGQLLLQIHAARSRLAQTNEFVRLLAASSLVVGNREDTLSDTGSTTDQHHPQQQQQRPSQFSNYLNLLSTFLYMTNYYIVAPTSATYADRVGSDSSIASIIIGMTSVAALASTFLYSWWTSYSYKSALIFASTCSVIGNLLYAAGLPCHSLEIVMLGRLLNGFGSARSINRRYIADSYSYAERTAASAMFVTATALGMATGPALAAILHLATAESDSLYWQTENAPGWFMFVVWIIFLICLIFKFEEPPRQLKPTEESGTKTEHHQQDQQQQAGSSEEKTPLLGNGETSEEATIDDNETTHAPLWRNIPVIITLMVYMVLKMTLEAVLSSESNLTAYYFDWEGDIMGVHLTILALLILPVNLGVAALARSYFDRELIIGLLMTMFIGCLVMLQYHPDHYSLAQYLVGSAILFVCASALEAPNMSLLSKVIPPSWRKGFINVGLLATESGTGGRVVGDLLLAAIASGHGLEHMLNHAYGSFAAIIFANIFVCFCFYEQLEPTEKDD